MIYLIGGVPGMRKSTVITPCICSQKPMYQNSTDLIRASTSQLYWSITNRDPHEARIPEIPELRAGEDTPAWIGTIGLIRLLNNQKRDALIEGIAIPPTGVRNLELQDPNLKVRAAFVGYNKTIEFQIPEWTPELENLIETAIGKEYLENFAKKHDWMYKNKDGEPSPYNDSEEAKRIEAAVETIRRLGCKNFKYFDLINYIPRKRRGEDSAVLRLEDHVNAAMDIRSFLLK